MSLRGLYVAVSDEEKAALLAAGSDDERLRILFEIEEKAFDENRAQETDKAWFPIHIMVCGRQPMHSPDRDPKTYPLDFLVMGGTSLYGKGDAESDDHIVRLIEPKEVAAIAAALPGLDLDTIRKNYYGDDGFDPEVDVEDDDFEYGQAFLPDIAAFFAREAKTGRTVVFSSDW